MKNSSLFSKDFLNSLSTGPGVYLMLGAQDEVLYVGKARNLKKRVRSYANYINTFSSKTGVLISKIASIKTILTLTEKEALLLESSLIKKHKPRYNIILRDDKHYPYLKLTVEENWPRLVVTRRKTKKDKVIFGPYSSTSAMWETVKLLNQFFPLRRCKTKDIKKRNRPCLNYQMNKCSAPCAGQISHKQYLQIVQDVKDVLLGKNKQVLGRIEHEMKEASRQLEFEKAALLRDKIKAIQKTTEKQMVSSSHHMDQDVLGFVRSGSSVVVSVIRIKQGVINSHENHYLEEPHGTDEVVLSEFMQRYYEKNSLVPKQILVTEYPADKKVLEEWVSDLRGAKVRIRKPLRGDFVKLIEIANKNAKQVFEDRTKKKNSWAVLSKNIQNECRLNYKPERIVCMDISNISGEHTVGSVVSFYQGEKDTKNYRHYKIKTVQGPDDYSSLAEMLDRYLVRGAEEKKLPNLLLIDGGKGQLNIAVQALKNHSLIEKLDVLGIAKEKNDEGEKIYSPGRKNPLKLTSHSAVLLFLMNIRDESHRYGITFHRKLRAKKQLASPLDDIEGIGAQKKQALLRKIGSVKRISQADIETLSRVKGIGPDLAAKIVQHFEKMK